MAVIVMGKESAVPQNKLYTIFPRTRHHWAAGYVNTAAKGEEGYCGLSRRKFARRMKSPTHRLYDSDAASWL
jgi:hypothetical protein